MISLIENLKVSREIKDALLKINTVARAGNKKIQASVKDLFIKSPECKELSQIGRCYERIIVSNRVYLSRGKKTYLELAFPASDIEEDYNKFFASPKLVAETDNYFSGVFLISFEQWNSANELIRSRAFSKLINYINNNKKYISFIFHVTPEFRDANVLQNELSKHLNFFSLEHEARNVEKCLAYVKEQFVDAGISISESGVNEIRCLIESKPNVMEDNALEQLVNNLLFEIYALVMQKRDIDECDSDNGVIKIGKREVKLIIENMYFPDEAINIRQKLGFN